MRINEVNGVKFITFDNLEGTGLVRHCFTTRVGGVCAGPCESLSFKAGPGCTPEDALENYRIISAAVGFDVRGIVKTHQTHTANVLVVGEGERGKGLTRPRGYTDVDGLVTGAPGVTLASSHADCAALFFLDPVKRIIGLAHAGWRGTLNGIAGATVGMLASLGADPADILAAVGPHIRDCCFEVSADVTEAFRDRGFGAYVRPANDKFHIDLSRVNYDMMLQSGLAPEHIEICGLCTKCRPDLFFSHRRSGGERGEMAGFLGLV